MLVVLLVTCFMLTGCLTGTMKGVAKVIQCTGDGINSLSKGVSTDILTACQEPTQYNAYNNTINPYVDGATTRSAPNSREPQYMPVYKNGMVVAYKMQ